MECWSGCETKLPGHWSVASAQSLVGECLTDQKKFAAAEPLLLASHEMLRKLADTPAAQLENARQRLRKLYTA